MLFLHRAKLMNSCTSSTPLQIVIWVEKTHFLCPPPPPPIWVPCLGVASLFLVFLFCLRGTSTLRSSCRLKFFYTWSLPFLWNKLSISLTHSKEQVTAKSQLLRVIFQVHVYTNLWRIHTRTRIRPHVYMQKQPLVWFWFFSLPLVIWQAKYVFF